MGYKHTWDRPREISLETFRAIVSDFRRLVPLLGEHGALLRAASMQGQPTLDDEQVSFNGLADCGTSCRKTVYDWLQVDPKGRDLHDVSWADLRCSCGHDAMYFPRVDHPDALNFCKTNRKRYDLAVTAFLVIAKHHLGDRLTVWSDSREAWWDVPRGMCQQVLGYGAGLPVARVWEKLAC